MLSFRKLIRRLSRRTSKTNSFELQLPGGGKLLGHLTPAGDLYLQFSESSMHRVPGHCIKPLAHWLSGVEGRYSWVRPAAVMPSAVVLPFASAQSKPLPGSYEDWLTED